ncbi:MAG: GNAT family protein [Elainellaceae cyanobacterium]
MAFELQLRQTSASDLDYVLTAETQAENKPYIMMWSRDRHRQAIADVNVAHLIVERTAQAESPTVSKRVGYLIMVGLQDPDQSIQLRRIVVTEKGRGIGRWAMAQVKTLAFETYQAHRLWLDVKPFNDRARALYKSAGFVEEGLLRDCHKTENGYESLVIMSMLRPEFDTEMLARSQKS